MTRRVALVAAAALPAAALLTAVADRSLGPRGAPPAAAPGPTLAPVPVVISDDERAAFVARLADGGSAGLAAWLSDHGGLVPGGLGAGTRTRTIERSGSGRGTVRLTGVEVRATDRRVTVVAVLDIASGLSWSLQAGRTTLQNQAGAADAGVPTVGALTFAEDRRPTAVTITAPEGVHWGVAAVFSS